jgi:hypothetical protein
MAGQTQSFWFRIIDHDRQKDLEGSVKLSSNSLVGDFCDAVKAAF